MVRISKYQLKDDVLMQLYRLFFELMSRSNSKDTFFEVINDIFSPSEKIMIAKRVAIIYLLLKGIDQRTISQTLKVSVATVSKFALIFYGKNTKVIELIKKMISKEKALDFLEDIFAGILIQPGIKIGHWGLYREHEDRKAKKKATGLE